MQRVLIFDYTLQGHHREYLHHLYMAAGQKTNEEYIFAVPAAFEQLYTPTQWPDFKNITFTYINERVLEKIPQNFLKRSWVLSKLLHKTAKRHRAQRVFLIELITFFPFLPFLLSRKVRVAGIIYLIYLYRWKKSSIAGRIKDLLKYVLIKCYTRLETVFILNDPVAACYLNKLFHSRKFRPLPDPYVPLRASGVKNMRDELKIPSRQKVILHFGALEKNKGTLDIYTAIRLMPPSQRQNFTFIFAGKVMEDIYQEFYRCYHELKEEASIILYDKFCPFELLGSLCLTCDAILIPYRRTCQSSGVIGYAAQFQKPVIAPREGLLGKLIRRNHLGLVLTGTTPQEIISALQDICNWKYKPNSYLSQNTITAFQKAIFQL